MQPVQVINGVNFYEAALDGSQTAEIRAVQATQYLNREFMHGLPVRVASTIYDEIIKAIHEDGKDYRQRMQAISVLVHNLQVRAANVLNTDNLFGLACIYFYIDGENPAMWDGKYDAQKYALMKQGTPDQQLFFCAAVLKYTPKLREIYSLDSLHSLKAADELIKMQSPLSSQIMNTLTQ